MKRLIPWCLLIGLVTSLVANWVLFRAAKQFYTREASVRLEPTGRAVYPQHGSVGQRKLLFLGDSRIAQWPMAGLDGLHICNAGVGNETTAQILLRTEAVLMNFRPEVVVIQAGINDLKTLPLFPGKESSIIDNCANNIAAILSLCEKHQARMVLLGILPTGNVPLTRQLVWSPRIGEAVAEVNQRLATLVSQKPTCQFLDVTADVTKADFVDTLHFTKAFYERITQRVMAAVVTR